MELGTTDTSRRHLLRALAGVAAAAALPGRAAEPAPVSMQPSSRDWVGHSPQPYPDPDIVALEPRFRRYILFNTPLQRLHTGTLWAEGPAWSGVGRYLVWSDIPTDAQMRWIEDDNRVTTFRAPSNYSNGNTFDYQGRQLSAEPVAGASCATRPMARSRSSPTAFAATLQLAQ